MRTEADIASLFAEIHGRVAPRAAGKGDVADYIPELARVNADRFGVFAYTLDGRAAGFGDYAHAFSIQSIVKVVTLTLAYQRMGERLWRRVGVEPSGGAFNSLIQLEHDDGIPRNPMLNAGALVVVDVLLELFDDPLEEVLRFLRETSGNPAVDFDRSVAASELATGHRNEALVQFMRSYGNIRHRRDTVVGIYCRLCAIAMSCEDLARTFSFFAGRGRSPVTGARVVSQPCAKRMTAIMTLCGFYDEAGEFAYRVGLPGKSGVGGGIVAVHPGEYAIAVYSPPLNRKGNSVLGRYFLEELTTIVGESIY